MKKIINKTVNLTLVGIDGNAFAIMGVFRKQAIKEGWTAKEIHLVLEEAQSDDYDHLLATIVNHCEEEGEALKTMYAIFDAGVQEEDKYIVSTAPTQFFDTKEEAQEELSRLCREQKRESKDFVIYSLGKKQ